MAAPSAPQVLRPLDGATVSGVITIELSESVLPEPIPPPIASFTWEDTAAGPRDIEFADTSTAAPGQTLTAWWWEFGAGGALGTSADQHPLLTDAPDAAIPVALTVTQDDGQTSAATQTIPARVVDVAPTIAIDQGAGGSLEVGQTVQLTATVTGEPAPSVTWSSSAPAIATVSAAGLVTAVAEGSATITATASNRAGSDSAGYALEVEAVEPDGTLDDFDRPDESLAASPNWAVSGGSMQIVGGAVQVGVAGGGVVARWTDPIGTNAFVEVVISALPNSDPPNPNVRLLARAASGADTWYEFVREGGDNKKFFLRRSSNGTVTQIADTPQGEANVALPETLRLEVQGSTLRCYQNGKLIFERSNTNITMGDRVGFRLFVPNGSDPSILRIDRFSAGAL